MAGGSEEDNVHNIPDNNNDNSDNERQMSIKPIADIEEVPIIETEIIEKPFNEILKTIEEKPEETHEEVKTEKIDEDKPKKTTKRDKEKKGLIVLIVVKS